MTIAELIQEQRRRNMARPYQHGSQQYQEHAFHRQVGNCRPQVELWACQWIRVSLKNGAVRFIWNCVRRCAELDASTKCSRFPRWRSAVVSLFPVANPGKIRSPKRVHDQEILRWVAGADKNDLQGWIQQLHRIVPELLIWSPSQVSGCALFCRSIRPPELSIRLQKNLFAVASRAHLGMGCRHIKDGRPTFEERRPEGYVLIPGNRPVIRAKIRRLLLAANNGIRTVD